MSCCIFLIGFDGVVDIRVVRVLRMEIHIQGLFLICFFVSLQTSRKLTYCIISSDVWCELDYHLVPDCFVSFSATSVC